MTSTAILTGLLAFSYIIGRFLRRFETPHFVFSGMIYLIIGLLIGSHFGFGILTKELLYKLEPLTDLLTGTAGFLLGLRVRFLLRNKQTFMSGAVTGMVTFSIMTIALFVLAPWVVELDYISLNLQQFDFLGDPLSPDSFLSSSFLQNLNSQQLWFALGVSATACSASLLSLGMVSKFHKATSEITRSLSIMAPSGQFMAVVFLGMSLAMARADQSSSALNINVGSWFLLALFSGLICGMLFSLFIGRQHDEKRILLAALGAVIFAAGIGSLLNISSMFVCFLTGATISMFSSYANVLKTNLIRVEEPIFVLLLVIGGATWQPGLEATWLLPAAYFLIRAIIFSTVTQKVHQSFTKRRLSRLGQGLLGQDLIAVAIALSLAKEFPALAQLFLTTILGSIFLNDFVANPLLKRVILDNEQAVEVEPILNKDEEE